MDVVQRNNVSVRGQGQRTLVFSHGFGTDQSAWDSVSRELARDHRIVLFDHVGFGGSDRLAYTDERHGAIEGYAQDLLEILERLDLSDVVFVGHSIGGVIGLLASIAQPARFERLVLINTTPRFIDEPPDYRGGFTREQILALQNLMKTDYDAWALSISPMAMGRQNDPSLIRSFGQSLHSLDKLIARRFGHIAFHVDCRRRLPEVTVPSLIIQSTHDEFAPRAVGRYLQTHLQGSRLREIEASGHCPHVSEPALVAAVLREDLATAPA